MYKYSYAILCNGAFPENREVLNDLLEADELICCDGAADAVLPFRIPDAVVGDLDSISAKSRKILVERVMQIDEQETNDLAKAFQFVCKKIKNRTKTDIQFKTCEAVSVKIFGATGKREDHTLGNISLLADFLSIAEQIERKIILSMVTDWGIFYPVSDTVSLNIPKGKQLSIFSFDPTLKIHSEGLRYSTDNTVFDMWWKASLNCVEKSPICLKFNHKAKVLIYIPFEEET